MNREVREECREIKLEGEDRESDNKQVLVISNNRTTLRTIIQTVIIKKRKVAKE